MSRRTTAPTIPTSVVAETADDDLHDVGGSASRHSHTPSATASTPAANSSLLRKRPVSVRAGGDGDGTDSASAAAAAAAAGAADLRSPSTPVTPGAGDGAWSEMHSLMPTGGGPAGGNDPIDPSELDIPKRLRVGQLVPPFRNHSHLSTDEQREFFGSAGLASETPSPGTMVSTPMAGAAGLGLSGAVSGGRLSLLSPPEPNRPDGMSPGLVAGTGPSELGLLPSSALQPARLNRKRTASAMVSSSPRKAAAAANGTGTDLARLRTGHVADPAGAAAAAEARSHVDDSDSTDSGAPGDDGDDAVRRKGGSVRGADTSPLGRAAKRFKTGEDASANAASTSETDRRLQAARGPAQVQVFVVLLDGRTCVVAVPPRGTVSDVFVATEARSGYKRDNFRLVAANQYCWYPDPRPVLEVVAGGCGPGLARNPSLTMTMVIGLPSKAVTDQEIRNLIANGAASVLRRTLSRLDDAARLRLTRSASTGTTETIQRAIAHDHWQSIRILLHYGYMVVNLDYIYTALQHGRERVLALLLGALDDLTVLNRVYAKSKERPLETALNNQREKAAMMLLRRGAVPWGRDIFAAAKGGCKDVLRFVAARHGALAIFSTEDAGQNALTLTLERGDVLTCAALLQQTSISLADSLKLILKWDLEPFKAKAKYIAGILGYVRVPGWSASRLAECDALHAELTSMWKVAYERFLACPTRDALIVKFLLKVLSLKTMLPSSQERDGGNMPLDKLVEWSWDASVRVLGALQDFETGVASFVGTTPNPGSFYPIIDMAYALVCSQELPRDQDFLSAVLSNEGSHLDAVDGLFLDALDARDMRTQAARILRHSFSLMGRFTASVLLLRRTVVRALLTFASRRQIFRSLLGTLSTGTSVALSVSRDDILSTSCGAVLARSPDDLRANVTVQFSGPGEYGIDQGGLSREWFQEVVERLVDPNAALFVSNDDMRTFSPRREAAVHDNYLAYFVFVGRIVGLALLRNVALGVRFEDSVYNAMIGAPLALTEVEVSKLAFFEEHTVDEISMVLGEDLTFSVALPNSLQPFDDVIDLMPNGANVRVTDETKDDFLRLYREFRRTDNGVMHSLVSLVDGVTDVIPARLLQFFDAGELAHLIAGDFEIQYRDWKTHTKYEGRGTATSHVVKWFWSIVKSFSQEERRALLQFATSNPCLPFGGFSQLQPAFTIAVSSRHSLARAHTCSNVLHLPRMKSKKALLRALRVCINYARGFGER